ncbi:MAG: hypothetical protein KGR26_01330 [Cyanobacteria bacterium REEB65]|nr:hypothetical protein [Cyanobacteria bacterium REEB65]
MSRRQSLPVSEIRFFQGSDPLYARPDWYADIERAPHVDQEEHRPRIELAARMIADVGPSSVVDLGAGDGGLLSLLGHDRIVVPRWGYDLIPANIAGAMVRGEAVRYGNFLTDPVEWGELCVMTETLEHLEDPHAAVRAVQSRYLVASSPFTEDEESHYEFHLWAWDMDGYRALLEQGGFAVMRHETVGIFQVILGERQ